VKIDDADRCPLSPHRAQKRAFRNRRFVPNFGLMHRSKRLTLDSLVGAACNVSGTVRLRMRAIEASRERPALRPCARPPLSSDRLEW
jgi:hypothetical protein